MELTLDEAFKTILEYKLGDDRRPMEFIADAVAAASAKPDALDSRALARRLGALLEVSATDECRDFALRQLMLIGGPEQLPSIAKRLDDPMHNHPAVAILERMESEPADKMLRDQLLLLGKDGRVMVINALGRRRDVASIPLFKELLCECEPEVASAVLAALAYIGTDDARRLIETKKSSDVAEVRFAMYDASLRVAQNLLDTGKRDEAAGLFENLWNDDKAPDPIRRGGLRGFALAKPEKAAGRLIELLSSNNSNNHAIALQILPDLPPAQARRVTDANGKFPAAAQTLLREHLATAP